MALDFSLSQEKLIKFDNVVKSLTYCVVAVFQKLDILVCIVSPLKNSYAFLSRLLLAGVYEPFYLAIRRLFKDFLRNRLNGLFANALGLRHLTSG